MSNLRTILEDHFIKSLPYIISDEEISQAEQKIKELMLEEDEIKTTLIELAFQRGTTEFILPDADVFAHTIHSAMLKKLED